MISFIICTKIVSNSIHQTQRNRKSVPIFIICICRRFWARVVVSIKAKNEQLFVGWCFIICLQLDNDPMNPIVCTSHERECLPSNIQRSEMKDDDYVFFGEPSFNRNVPISDDDVMTTFWQQRRRKRRKSSRWVSRCFRMPRLPKTWRHLAPTLFCNFFCKNTRKTGHYAPETLKMWCEELCCHPILHGINLSKIWISKIAFFQY